MKTYKVYKFTIKKTDKNLSNVKTTDRPAYNMLKLTIKQTDKTKQLNYREKKQTDKKAAYTIYVKTDRHTARQTDEHTK